MSIAAGQKTRPPASPTRRTNAPRKRGDDTRAKIIDETVRCIVEEGFAAATAKHVAERAGVTWGVIQYHFGDRNGLLMAVVDDGVARLLESLSSADVGELRIGSTCGRIIELSPACDRSTFVVPHAELELRAITGSRQDARNNWCQRRWRYETEQGGRRGYSERHR